MKKAIGTTIFLILFFGGCAWVGKQYDYISLCTQDPQCLSDVKKDSDTWKAIAGSAYPVAAIPVGIIAFTISAWIRGKKKNGKTDG
jgi:hypothetical protein